MTTDAAATQPSRTTYHEELKGIPDPIADILETYSGIPRNEQKEHILNLRNRAYQAYPYPCLGRFRFLELDLSNHPLYEEHVLSKLRKPALGKDNIKLTFLDLGTCLGQDIRKLIFDGADPERLYGSDIVPEFRDAGYELFRDEHKFPRSHFICPADVFDRSSSSNLSALDGKVDILHATAVFHLFSQAQQVAVAERCLKLLRKDPGCRGLILGGQAGNINAMETSREDRSKKYRHNEQSWRALWEDVCDSKEFKGTVKKLDVGAKLYERMIGYSDDSEQQRQIESTEQGFRWMVWWVWIEF